MMDSTLPLFTVGEGDWHRIIRTFTDQLDRHYWDAFEPAPAKEIEACEAAINRQLPEDFRQFFLHLGSGTFRWSGGCIYTTQEIVDACIGPFLMVLGSCRWASDEEQRKLYSSRGQYNPAPDRFTAQALHFGGHSLLDLLQIGTNGSGCYHQLFVGSTPAPFGYCLLTPEGTEEDKFPSFSEALRHILLQERRSALGKDEGATPGLAVDWEISEE